MKKKNDTGLVARRTLGTGWAVRQGPDPDDEWLSMWDDGTPDWSDRQRRSITTSRDQALEWLEESRIDWADARIVKIKYFRAVRQVEDQDEILVRLTKAQLKPDRMMGCECGHNENNHFDYSECPCAHCNCKSYTPKLITPPQLTIRVRDLSLLGAKK